MTSSRLLPLAAALLAAAFSPAALGQAAPLGGSVTVSLSAGLAAPGGTFGVSLLVDMTKATGTCAGTGVVPATLGAYNLGVAYDATALQYTGATSCNAAQFTNPVCADHGAFVNCNDANNGYTSSPQGSVCVARLLFKSLGASGSSTRLSVLRGPLPRGVASGLVLGCGGPAEYAAATILGTPATFVMTAPLGSFSAD